MERINLEKLKEKIERYQTIVEYYAENTSRVKPNREQLFEIQSAFCNIIPPYLLIRVGKESSEGFVEVLSLSTLVSGNQENLAKLLSQN